MIYHSPPFPLVLDYGPRILKTWSAEDELGLLLTSQHLPRVTEIVLSAPELTLAKLTTGLTELAPRLEKLVLHSQTSEVVLPKQFLEGGAPQLRHLILTGASLSPLQPVLSSATSLVSLALERIPSSAYFSPDSLITLISAMPHLQILSIGFLSTVPRPGFRGQRVPPRVQATRTELPTLTQLIYRGVSQYIEALLSRIRSPRIEDVDVSLFNQLTLGIPRTCTFLRDLGSLRPTRAHIDFAETSAHITLSAPQPTASPDIFLSVSCARLDFQLSATAQLCAALSASLEPAEELVLGYYGGAALPEEWRDEVDIGLWRALLAPFSHVGTLRVHVALVDDIERALRIGPAAGQMLLLPEMREIVLLHASDENALKSATTALGAFVDERGSAGCPVKVRSLDLSGLAESETVKAVSSRRRLQKL